MDKILEEQVKKAIDEFCEKAIRASRFLDTFETVGRFAKDSFKQSAKEMAESEAKAAKAFTDVVEPINSFMKSILNATAALTDFKGFDKQQTALGEGSDALVDAQASDGAADLLAGAESAAKDAVPSAAAVENPMPLAGQATLAEMPKIDANLTNGFTMIEPPLKEQADTVGKIFKTVEDISKTQHKNASQSNINDLMGKNKPKTVTESQVRNAKAGMVVDSVAIGKEIAGGIKGTLGALLNPVALVAAFIVKFAPYIFLAICFLYGVWQELSDDLKTKIKIWGALLIPGIIGSFIAFKGIIPALIKGVMMAIKVYTLITRMKEHKAIMAIYARMATEQTVEHTANMTNAATERVEDSVEHSMNIGNSIFERMCTWISTVFRKVAAFFDMICSRIVAALKALWTAITGAFDMACNVAKVAMAAVAIVIIIGIVILLVAGIFLIMILLSAAINKAVADIIIQFKRIGSEIKEMVNSIIDPITEVLNGLMSEMRKLFYDVKYGDETSLRSGNNVDQNNNKQKAGVIQGELTVKDGVTKDDFNSVVTAITAPLNIMVLELGTMIALETAQLMMSNPFGALIALGTGAVGAGLMMSRTSNTASTSDTSETNIQRQETNTTTTENNNGFDPETKKKFNAMCDNLDKLVKKLQPYSHMGISPIR